MILPISLLISFSYKTNPFLSRHVITKLTKENKLMCSCSFDGWCGQMTFVLTKKIGTKVLSLKCRDHILISQCYLLALRYEILNMWTKHNTRTIFYQWWSSKVNEILLWMISGIWTKHPYVFKHLLLKKSNRSLLSLLSLIFNCIQHLLNYC